MKARMEQLLRELSESTQRAVWFYAAGDFEKVRENLRDAEAAMKEIGNLWDKQVDTRKSQMR